MKTKKTSEKPFVIVVGIDFTDLSDLALERACDLAHGRRGTQIHVIYVQSTEPLPSASESNGGPNGGGARDTGRDGPDTGLGPASTCLHARVEQVVRRWSEAHSSQPAFDRLTTHVRREPPAEAIAQLATDLEASLVIVGTHGRRGARRFLLGSIAEATVRLAGCDVLVVRPPDSRVPMIEPACPRCLEVRQTSVGRDLWCTQHLEQQERRHTYHYSPVASAHQSGLLIHVS